MTKFFVPWTEKSPGTRQNTGPFRSDGSAPSTPSKTAVVIAPEPIAAEYPVSAKAAFPKEIEFGPDLVDVPIAIAFIRSDGEANAPEPIAIELSPSAIAESPIAIPLRPVDSADPNAIPLKSRAFALFPIATAPELGASEF